MGLVEPTKETNIMPETSHLDVVKEILLDQLGCDDKVIEMDTEIRALGADSLDDIELIMAFEDAYDIEIDDDKAEKIRTVGDIVRFLEENADLPES